MRWAGLVAATLLASVVVSGCGDDDGPMELVGYGGMVVDGGQADDVWFRVTGCLEEGSDPVDVMVTDVTTEAAGPRLEARVAWNDDSEIVIAQQGEPPPAYRPVTATTPTGGTLDDCSLDLAVMLSADDQPVVVRAVEVRYEIDGEEHTARTDLSGTLCPPGTRAGDTHGSCREVSR